jgi:hypothetical protein
MWPESSSFQRQTGDHAVINAYTLSPLSFHVDDVFRGLVIGPTPSDSAAPAPGRATTTPPLQDNRGRHMGFSKAANCLMRKTAAL